MEFNYNQIMNHSGQHSNIFNDINKSFNNKEKADFEHGKKNNSSKGDVLYHLDNNPGLFDIPDATIQNQILSTLSEYNLASDNNAPLLTCEQKFNVFTCNQKNINTHIICVDENLQFKHTKGSAKVRFNKSQNKFNITKDCKEASDDAIDHNIIEFYLEDVSRVNKAYLSLLNYIGELEIIVNGKKIFQENNEHPITIIQKEKLAAGESHWYRGCSPNNASLYIKTTGSDGRYIFNIFGSDRRADHYCIFTSSLNKRIAIIIKDLLNISKYSWYNNGCKSPSIEELKTIDFSNKVFSAQDIQEALNLPIEKKSKISSKDFTQYLKNGANKIEIKITGMMSQINLEGVLNISPYKVIESQYGPIQCIHQKPPNFPIATTTDYSNLPARKTIALNCYEKNKKCIDNKPRRIGGQMINRCWHYRWDKVCYVNSQNNCKVVESNLKEDNIISLYDKKEYCLIQDRSGNCLNTLYLYILQKKNLDNQNSKSADDTKLKLKEMIDANYNETNPTADLKNLGHVMSVVNIAKESTSSIKKNSNVKSLGEQNIAIFGGHSYQCKDHSVGAMSCCNLSGGWSEMLGVRCNSEEETLKQLRLAKKCIYLGRKKHYTLGLESSITQHYCCFNDILDKTVQIGCRQQLNLGFGSPDSPRCYGLSIQQIQATDFSKINWQEFQNDFFKNFKITNKVKKTFNFEQWQEREIGSLQKRKKSSFLPKAKKPILDRELELRKIHKDSSNSHHNIPTDEFMIQNNKN